MRALSNSRSLRLAAVLFLAVVLGSACETEGPGTEEMSETGFAALNPGDQWAVPLDELNRLLAAHPGAIILDVSPHDQQGMVPGAFALPVDRSPFEEKLLALDPEEPYLVFSAIRPDAERVTEMLVDAGFLSVVGLLAVPEMPADAEEPFGFGDWNPEELYVVPADQVYEVTPQVAPFLLNMVIDVKPREVPVLMKTLRELVIIDVSHTWLRGHIPGALNFPHGDHGEVNGQLLRLDKRQAYLVYGDSELTATISAEAMVRAGFASVYRLEGGLEAWKAAGYEVEVGEPGHGTHTPRHGQDPHAAPFEYNYWDVDEFKWLGDELGEAWWSWPDLVFFPFFSVIDVKPREVLVLMQTLRELVIIDVSHTWLRGHIPGALNFPHGDHGEVNGQLLRLDKRQAYLVYGDSELTATISAEAMVRAGFVSVFRLEGGLEAWKAAGYEVEVGEPGHGTHTPRHHGEHWESPSGVGPGTASKLTVVPVDRIYEVEPQIAPFFYRTFLNLTPRQTLNLIQTLRDLVIIDVSQSFEEGHIPGAFNFPYGPHGVINPWLLLLDRDVPYLVYGNEDLMAKVTAGAMVNAGFTWVFRLEGGLEAWKAAGYTVEHGHLAIHDAPLPGADFAAEFDRFDPDDLPGMAQEIEWDLFTEPPPPKGEGDYTESPSGVGPQVFGKHVEAPVDRVQWVEVRIRPVLFRTSLTVEPREALNLISTLNDIVVVDISHEFEEGHIPGAVSYPYGPHGVVNPSLLALPKDTPYLVYGNSEILAEVTAEAMVGAGFTWVFRLEGTLRDWEAEGYEVELGNLSILDAPLPGKGFSVTVEKVMPDDLPDMEQEILWDSFTEPPPPK